MTVMTILLLLGFFGAVLWLFPKLIVRSVLKVPSRVPQQWVDDYRAGDR